MTEKALAVNKLRKVFGGIVAVNDVSFEIAGSEIVGLLGPNGAGKTTTINMILGTLTPTSGLVKVNGMDIVTHRSEVLKCTNFAAVYAPLPGNLTIYENLRIFALLYGVKVDIVLWGFLTRYLNTLASASFNFVPALLGAVVFWDFFIRIMQGVTMAFMEDVWARNFLNIFSTPISIMEYIAGLILSSIATSSVGIVVMFVLAVTVFGLSFVSYGALVIPFLIVLFMFGIALGIAASALVLRLGPAAE